MTKAAKAELLDNLAKAIEGLTDVFYTDTAAVDVQLDAVASAFLDLKPIRRPPGKESTAPTLIEILSQFVEEDYVKPFALSLVDEITDLIEYKDYEGYSEEYVSEALESLLSDLQHELESAIEKLRTKARQ